MCRLLALMIAVSFLGWVSYFSCINLQTMSLNN